MASKILEPTDYRVPIADKYGRRTCDHCGKFRRVNAYWKDRNYVLCKQCSIAPGVAFAASVRGGAISLFRQNILKRDDGGSV